MMMLSTKLTARSSLLVVTFSFVGLTTVVLHNTSASFAAGSAQKTFIEIAPGINMPYVCLSAAGGQPEGNTLALLENGVRSLNLMSHSSDYAMAAFKKEFGEALTRGIVKRNEVFIHLMVTHKHDAEEVMNKHGLDYVDLLGQHNPAGPGGSDALFKGPYDADAMIAQYQGLEALYKQGRAHALGVGWITGSEALAAFMKLHAAVEIKPLVNQVAVSPKVFKANEYETLKRLGVHNLAFSILGNIFNHYNVYEPAVVAIGAKYGKTPQQVIMRWCVEREMGFVTSTKNMAHARADLDIFDFRLTDTEIQAIETV